jgi:hypothetical protein
LRDFILCAIIVSIVSTGTTLAQRYVAGLRPNPTSGHAEAPPLPQAEPDAEGVLFLDGAALIVQTAPPGLSRKAEPPPLLGQVAPALKPAAQPSPAVPTPAASKPEKKMVGPDGVTFTRSAHGPR